MKLFNKLRSLSIKSKIAAAVVTVGVAASAPFAVNAGFFPDRPTYDYNKFDASVDCADVNNPAVQNSRCGSMNGPVFNSFVNTPSYGDERQFLDGRKSDQPMPYNNTDTVTDVTTGTKKVVIRMYVHNNANQTTNETVGMARNAKAKVELPTQSGSALQAVGAISASNASEVTDTVFLTGSRKFKVAYEAGSAKLMRNNVAFPLSDSIVTTGAPIGHTAMDGNLPGCFDFAALVEITVNIIPEESTELQLVKEVKRVGEQGWKKEVVAKPGEEVQWLLTTKNIGLDQLTNVEIRDILPPHLELVPGSVKVVNTDQQSFPYPDAQLFGNGIGLGTYPSGGGRYVMFKVKTLSNFEGCEIRVRNVAKAQAEQVPTEVSSDADVVIKKENCQPTTPTYSCDSLKAEKTTGRTVKYTVNASAAGGATIQRFIYDFGDGQTQTIDKNTVEHTYQKDGQYATRVKVQFAVGNQTVFAEGAQCASSVTYATDTPVCKPGDKVHPVTGKPCVVTTGSTTPTKLPEAGAGGVIATFAVVTAVSTLGYYTLARRSYGA